MISSIKYLATVIVSATCVGLGLGTPAAKAGSDGQTSSDKLPLSIRSTVDAGRHNRQAHIHWKNVEYDIALGIEKVMAVIRDPKESSRERELALIQLAMLRTQLHGHRCLDELAEHYNHAEPLEKELILTCFMGSRDRRAIRIFSRVLNDEESLKLRLVAATGLAGWNIRRGVSELVKLAESEEILPQPVRMPSVRDNALESFRNANTRKRWGFPKNEWWRSIDGLADLDEDQKKALYSVEIEKEIKQIREWFEANKQRFPDWKPGDPLPESTPDQDKGSPGE